MGLSTIDDLEPETDRDLTQRKVLYGATTVVLTLIMVLGVVDAFGWFDAYGVDTATARAEGGGYTLEVSYPSVSRPALASPFEIVITGPDGFDGPVTVAVTADYLKMWDENGLVPAPAAETMDGEWVLWEFDPPETDALRVFYDARIEPAVQSGRTGRVAVIDDGERVVQVEFRTEVRP
ncbi:MAG: hypothetical protein ABW219_12315 [Ilumatobacteraceae bacterium]